MSDMTDRQAPQTGKVSFKSLDSESMAAARAAAKAAGLTLEEWLSRTILRNAESLGISPKAPPPDADSEVEEAQGSLDAIKEHLEGAQRAADEAGVSVAEWLSNTIIERTAEGQQALSDYAERQGTAPAEATGQTQEAEAGPTEAEVVERTDQYTTLKADHGNRRVTVRVDHPVRTEGNAAQGAAEAPPAEDPLAAEYRQQQEPSLEPDYTDEQAYSTDHDYAADQGAVPTIGEDAEAAPDQDPAATLLTGGEADPAAQAQTEADTQPEAEGRAGSGLSADDERRLADLITRRREEQMRHEPDRQTPPQENYDDALDLTTPLPPDADMPEQEARPAGVTSGLREKRRRGRSWIWSLLLLVLALMAAAIWIVPNMDRLGLDGILGGEQSATIEDGRQSDAAGTETGGRETREDAGDETGNAAGTEGGDEAQSGDGQSARDENGSASRDTAEGDLSVVPESRFPRPAGENVEWYRRAAEAGNSQAQYVLGTLYLQGSGVERDFGQAAGWFRRAGEEGNLAQAQYALGVLYERGLGVEENQLEALILFQKAADQGHVLGLTKVGEAYLHGRGIAQDYDQARRNFERAAEAGEPNAQYALGRMYELGLGMDPDLVQALKWFTLAAEGEHRQASSRVEAIVPELTQEQRDRAADLVIEHRRRFGSGEGNGD